MPRTPSELPLLARVPRYQWPSIYQALKRTGAPYETGNTDHAAHTLEVFCSTPAASVIRRYDIPVTSTRRKPPWRNPERLPAKVGTGVYRAAPSGGDALDKALEQYRRELFRLRNDYQP